MIRNNEHSAQVRAGKISLETIDGVEEVTIVDPFEPGEGVACFTALAGMLKGDLRLYDFSVGWDASTDEIKRVAELAEDLITTTAKRVALLAPEDLSYGLARMYQAYRNTDKALPRFKVCRSREEALAWLKT